jgi:hypothetical protein
VPADAEPRVRRSRPARNGSGAGLDDVDVPEFIPRP